MIKYPKIPSIFARDSHGKMLEGVYSTPYLEHLQNIQWIFTEKIDGTNIRVMWDGYKISIGGRTDNANNKYPGMDECLNDLFYKTGIEELFEQTFGDKEVMLFGEAYGESINKNRHKIKGIQFVIFDIMINGVWLSYENVKSVGGDKLGYDVVSSYGEGTLSEAVDFVKKECNTIHQNGLEPEGIVCKPLCVILDNKGYPIYTKIKIKDFR